MPDGPFDDRDDVRGFVERAPRDAGAGRARDPAARRPPVGIATYLRIDHANGTAEVGHISFSTALQRTTAATEAMYLMAAHAFDVVGVRRYEWKCDSLNEASRRAATRLGFAYEGTFRQAVVYKGRNRDTAWFAITDEQWPRIRTAFESWLDPANFDEHGQQRHPLTTLEEQR